MLFANDAFARGCGLRPQDLEGTRIDWDAEEPRTGSATVRLSLPGGGRLKREGRRLRVGSGEEELLLFLPAGSDGGTERTGALLHDLEREDRRLRKLHERLGGQGGEAEAALPTLRDGLEARHALAVESLNRALDAWCRESGRSKADLAEASGLWKVHPDANGWRRTVTLDKYLDLATIPRFPKWKTVAATLEFVRGELRDPAAAASLEPAIAALRGLG